MAVDIRWKRLDEIKTHADLALFPVGATELKAITTSMREHGYDPAQPIVVWAEQGYVVDGHTRLQAATETRQELVPVYEQSFEDWDEALDYAIARQRDRRNLSRQQLTAYIAHVVRSSDRVRTHGGDRRSEDFKTSPEVLNGGKSSSAELGAKLGVSHATVERTRAVLAADDDDEDISPIKEQLLAGEIAPKAAYAEVKRIEAIKEEGKLHSKPTAPMVLMPKPPARRSFSIEQWEALDAGARADAIRDGRRLDASLNPQNTDNIEWARWSWNPITGCLHNCPYCYARDIAVRFTGTEAYPRGFAPTFQPWRLGAPSLQRVPASAEQELGYRNIFTCSMADLFGKWVPAEWIEAVLDVVRENPQWNFLLLTKFPVRLAEFTFPDNAWLGTSVDCQARVKNAERSFARVRGGVKWLSIEPMLEPLRFDSLDMFDWLAIGGASASTQTPAWIPPRRWVLDLECQARDASCMIYEKTNLGIQGPSRLREYPGWERREQRLPDALAYLPTIGQDATEEW